MLAVSRRFGAHQVAQGSARGSEAEQPHFQPTTAGPVDQSQELSVIADSVEQSQERYVIADSGSTNAHAKARDSDSNEELLPQADAATETDDRRALSRT